VHCGGVVGGRVSFDAEGGSKITRVANAAGAVMARTAAAAARTK